MIRRTLVALLIMFPFAPASIAGRKGEAEEIRIFTLSGMEHRLGKVTLITADGQRLDVAESDLKIVDHHGKSSSSARRSKPEQKLTTSTAAVPAVARIKYNRDGSVKKVKLRLFETSAEALEAAAKLERKENERPARSGIPKNKR